MKKILLILVCLFFLIIAKATLPVEIDGSAWKLLTLKTVDEKTYMYVKNYQNQLILFYKANFLYTNSDPIGVDQDDDVFSAVFDCSLKEICNRFFDRKTNALSKVYPAVLAANTKESKQVVAYYDKKSSTLFIETMFTPCKKPLAYPFKIEADSEFGDGTDFLPNGNLLLYYNDANGNSAAKVITVDYPKLFARCKNN